MLSIKRAILLFLRCIFVCAILLMIFVSLSGILLKYQSKFGLDNIAVNTDDIVLKHFFDKADSNAANIQGFLVGGSWYFSYEGTVYRDVLEWEQCNSAFVSVMQIEGNLLLACEESLRILGTDGSVQEIVDEQLGLSTPIYRVGRVKQQVFFESEGGVYNIDLKSFELFLLPNQDAVQWQEPQLVPETYTANIAINTRSAHDVVKKLHGLSFVNSKWSLLTDFLIFLAVLLLFALLNMLMNTGSLQGSIFKETNSTKPTSFTDDVDV